MHCDIQDYLTAEETEGAQDDAVSGGTSRTLTHCRMYEKQEEGFSMDQIFSPEKSQGPPVNPSKQELEKDPKRSTEEGGPQAEMSFGT